MIRRQQFDQASINGVLYMYGDRVMLKLRNQPPIKATITGIEETLIRYRGYRRKLHVSVMFSTLDSIQMGWEKHT